LVKIFQHIKTNKKNRNPNTNSKKMKNSIKTTILGLALAVSSVIFAQDKMANNIDNSNIALEGYSPVSYLDLELAQMGNKAYKSEHKKVVYYFTSADQKATFDKNPEKYVPQYGGYCAFGCYAGAKFRVNPNKFIVEDGKYYLYLTNVELDAKQLWLAENNHSKLKSVADKNWEKLSKTHN
jgi:YHS domain-containing protein